MNVILYGIGRNAIKTYSELKGKYNIVCFTDKDKTKHNTAIKMPDGNEFTILPLENALKKFLEAKLWVTPISPLRYEIMYELLNGANNNIKIEKELILNFESDTYKYYYGSYKPKIMFHQVGNNNLYVEQINAYTESCEKDYRLNESAKEVSIIENGIILPAKLVSDFTAEGGVCDAEGNFIDGHLSGLSVVGLSIVAAYQIKEEINRVKETVVYGGFVYNHFGHMVIESLSRMWWFLENRDCGHKFVFISHNDSEHDNIKFIDYFLLLGLKEEDIILLKEPSKFDKIVVPRQSIIPYNGFKNKAKTIFNTIRDNVVPTHYEKIYLTRTKLSRRDTINEEYFEDYYCSIGYEIIAMEQLSIREQISIIAGAKHIACVSGSLQHHILFSQDGVNITLLNKLCYINPVVSWINQMRSATCTFIDVSMNFLPALACHSSYLLMPTAYWKQYVKDSGGEFKADDDFCPPPYRNEIYGNLDKKHR
jgi:hypothetical protein